MPRVAMPQDANQHVGAGDPSASQRMPRMQQNGNGQTRPSRRTANGQRPSAQASQRMPRVEGQRPSAAQRQQRPFAAAPQLAAQPEHARSGCAAAAGPAFAADARRAEHAWQRSICLFAR